MSPLNCENIHKLARTLAERGRTAAFMEVCGTHTMAIARSGLRSLLPGGLRLISGPGCPVCVSDPSYIDRAVALARGVAGDGAGAPVVATYGDMVRVPGRHGSLAEARAQGAAVEVVSSAERALELARAKPDRAVVFLAVGFETTAPGTALAVLQARREGLRNFTVLPAHKLIPPVMRAILSAGDVRVDGFLCPGHVSVIVGYGAYEGIVRDFGRPCVVAGFDPGQIVEGVAELLRQLVEGAPRACTVYPSVSREGNATAQRLLEEVFEIADERWRALGVVPLSGLKLRKAFAEFDAAERFSLPQTEGYEVPGCRCGDVLCGRCEPRDCALFGGQCTPREPLGPCMVSSEGACAAAYKYERRPAVGAAR